VLAPGGVLHRTTAQGTALNNQLFSKVAVWLVIALVLFTVFKQFDRGAVAGGQIGYSDFLEEVRSKRIKSVTLQEGSAGGTEIIAMTTDDKRLRSTATYLDRGLVGDLINNGVKFDVKPREEPSLLMTILISWGPFLLLIGVWVYFMRQMQGGGKGGAFRKPRKRSRNWSTS
jgi:cell division protease FtsH